MDGLNNALREFFAWTAWGMDKPPAYGAFHLTFTFVGLALSIFAAYKLRKLGDKGNRALLLGCGIFLLICEGIAVPINPFPKWEAEHEIDDKENFLIRVYKKTFGKGKE